MEIEHSFSWRIENGYLNSIKFIFDGDDLVLDQSGETVRIRVGGKSVDELDMISSFFGILAFRLRAGVGVEPNDVANEFMNAYAKVDQED